MDPVRLAELQRFASALRDRLRDDPAPLSTFEREMAVRVMEELLEEVATHTE